MTHEEISQATKAAFKAFDDLKPGQGIDITLTKTYKLDKEIMTDICRFYIDGRRASGFDDYVLSDDYKIIKRVNN